VPALVVPQVPAHKLGLHRFEQLVVSTPLRLDYDLHFFVLFNAWNSHDGVYVNIGSLAPDRIFAPAYDDLPIDDYATSFKVLLKMPLHIVGEGHFVLRSLRTVVAFVPQVGGEIGEFSPGGRYNAYSGTCGACVKVGAALQSEAPNSVTYSGLQGK
jgi:hypothetical protein